MRKFTDKEILDRVEQLPTFKGWRDGIYDVWIRSAADKFDAFDDKGFTYICSADGQRPKFVMAREGTTNAGSYGLKHFDEYNHLGCAVLKSNCMVYGSHTYGLHRGKKPAYRQSKGFPYYRDNNRNERAEEIGKVYTDIIGANIHRAGVDSTVIKNWSTACIVTGNESKFLQFLDYMKSKGKPSLTLVILKEWQVGDPPLKGSAAVPAGGKPDSLTENVPNANQSSGAGNDTNSAAQPPTDLAIEQTVVETSEGQSATSTTTKNEQDVNTSVVVSSATYQGVGFIGALKKDFAVVGGGNLSFQTLQEYATQASGWPPWVISIITKLATLIAVIGACWLLFRLTHYVIWKIGDWKRQQTEATINSDITKKNVEWYG